jgi:glycosyltransferase involved in cell wall biosynthesis
VSAPLPAALRGRDIVCVGFADWDNDVWTNQHHLMARLAEGNRVLFVESLGLRRPTVSGRDLSRIARRLKRGLSGPRRSPEGVWVLSPLVLPLHGVRLARELNRRLLPALARRAARRIGMSRPILWAYVPQAEVLVGALDPELVVYHCVDDLGAFEGIDAAGVAAAEARFVPRADLVLASSPTLAAKMRRLSDRVVDAPNVADTALFSTALQPGPVDAALAALPEPRVVFVGAVVTKKLDVALLVGLARARRDWSIALVGPVGVGDPTTDVSALEAEPNIHLLGGRPYRGLPEILRGAAAGLIPYALNPYTAGVFPMKVYEYLAAGLPVVSTPLPSLAGVDEVSFASGAPEAAEALDALIARDSRATRAERSRLAASHSWDARLEQIAAALGDGA